jgi:hypothetical protein
MGNAVFLEPRPSMTIHIELAPDEERALLEQARVSGRDLAGYIHQVLRDHLRIPPRPTGRDRSTNGAPPTLGDLIDDDAITSCEREADDGVSLEEVRAATSTIKDSMARVVIEDERAERS